MLVCSLIFLTFIVNRYLVAYRIQCFCYFMLKLWRYRFPASGFHFCCWAVSSQPNCPSFVIIYILTLATLRASFHIWETAFSQCCVWYGFLYIYLLFCCCLLDFLNPWIVFHQFWTILCCSILKYCFYPIFFPMLLLNFDWTCVRPHSDLHVFFLLLLTHSCWLSLTMSCFLHAFLLWAALFPWRIICGNSWG